MITKLKLHQNEEPNLSFDWNFMRRRWFDSFCDRSLNAICSQVSEKKRSVIIRRSQRKKTSESIVDWRNNCRRSSLYFLFHLQDFVFSNVFLCARIVRNYNLFLCRMSERAEFHLMPFIDSIFTLFFVSFLVARLREIRSKWCFNVFRLQPMFPKIKQKYFVCIICFDIFFPFFLSFRSLSDMFFVVFILFGLISEYFHHKNRWRFSLLLLSDQLFLSLGVRSFVIRLCQQICCLLFCRSVDM